MDDVQEAVQIEANLAALPGSPTDEQILQAVKGFRGQSISMAIYKTLLAGGGGGGSPAGDPGEIQFNDSGAFGASPHFVWEDHPDSGNLKLVNAENSTAVIETAGIGTQLQIHAADGDADHVGGEISITSGTSDGNAGGDVAVVAGSDASSGDGGNIQITSGSSVEWNGGDIAIRANGGSPAGNNGGDISIIAGQGAVHGGDIVLQAGTSDGDIQLYAGDSNQAIQLDNNGLNVLATKLGFYGASPVVQPGVPVTLGDVISALQALGLVAT